jgi:hypothetical protein
VAKAAALAVWVSARDLASVDMERGVRSAQRQRSSPASPLSVHVKRLAL